MSAFQAEYEGSIPLLRSRYRCSSGVEQQIHILWVIGSNPINGTIIGVWCNGSIPVSKTVGESSSLSTPAWILRYGVMAAQWILVPLVQIRILVPQQICTCGWVVEAIGPQNQ